MVALMQMRMFVRSPAGLWLVFAFDPDRPAEQDGQEELLR